MKEDFLKLVSTELRLIRVEHGDYQEDLATKSGVAASTISKYESGDKNMKLSKIEQIIKPYGLELNIFFNRVIAKTHNTNNKTTDEEWENVRQDK